MIATSEGQWWCLFSVTQERICQTVTTWSLPSCPILCLAFLQNIQEMKMTMKPCLRPLQVAGVFSLLFYVIFKPRHCFISQHEMQALHSGHWPSHNPLLGLFLHCAFISRALPDDFFSLFFFFFLFSNQLHTHVQFCHHLIAVKWCKISGWCKNYLATIYLIQFH